LAPQQRHANVYKGRWANLRILPVDQPHDWGQVGDLGANRNPERAKIDLELPLFEQLKDLPIGQVL
jgi:hypothetical protein